MQYLIAADWKQLATSGRFVGPIDPDSSVKLRYPRLNRSQEIPPEANRSGIFNSFFYGNFRPEAVSDVIHSFAIECVCMDVPVKFGNHS